MLLHRMNIVLFISKDLAGCLAFNELYPRIGTHIRAVFYSTGVGNKDRKVPALQLLEYYEAVHPFEVVFPQLDTGSFITIEDITSRTGIPCSAAPEMDESFAQHLRALKADLFLSVRFGKLFKGSFLSIAPMGILNLHSAILPAYRGILGTLHSLLDGRNQIGCTLHYVPDEGIDNGAILGIATLPVHPDRSLFWHVWNLYPGGVQLIDKVVQQLAEGITPPAAIQDAGQSRYFSLPSTHHFELLKAKGVEIITQRDYTDYFSTSVGTHTSHIVTAALAKIDPKYALS